MIKAFFTEKLTLKLVALLLACVFWVVLEEKHDVNEPVEFDLKIVLPPHLADRYVITRQQPRTIELQLEGSNEYVKKTREFLNRYGVINNAVFLDEHVFDGIVPGKALRFELTRANIDPPPMNVLMTLNDPVWVTLELDALTEKELRVRIPNLEAVNVKENMPLGYGYFQVRILPETLKVSGPSSLLETMDVIATEPLPLEPGGFTLEKPVYFLKIPPMENETSLLQAEAASVEVRLDFITETTQLVIDVEEQDLLKKIQVRFPLGKKIQYKMDPWTPAPHKKSFVLEGPSTLLKEIEKSPWSLVYIDLSGVTSANDDKHYRLELQNPYPGRVEIKQRPDSVYLDILQVEPDSQ